VKLSKEPLQRTLPSSLGDRGEPVVGEQLPLVDHKLDLVVQSRLIAPVNDEVVDIAGVANLELDTGYALAVSQEMEGVEPGVEVLVVVASHADAARSRCLRAVCAHRVPR
jgi:hypothetical protein